MGGLYINEISTVQLIGLYKRVTRVCIGVIFTCRFYGKWMREFFFFNPSPLLILTNAVGVILGR